MNLALRIHVNYLDPILTGPVCQQIQKGAAHDLNHPIIDDSSKMPLLFFLYCCKPNGVNPSDCTKNS
jgi:hypothetical protein